MHRELKSAVFAILLIAACYFFGDACGRMEQGYGLILHPSREVLLGIALHFFLAIGVVTVTAGLVAALVRPRWACFLVFGLSALAMLLGWELKASSGMLTGVYFLASLFYANGIAEELSDRLSFSVGPIWHSQSILLTALVLVMCGSFYFGYAAEIDRAGLSIPPYLVEIVMERVEEEVSKLLPESAGEEAIAQFAEQLEGTLQEMAKEISGFLPENVREVAVAQFREQLARALGEMQKEASERVQAADREAILAKFRDQLRRALVELLENAIRPYQRWIPLVLAINLFTLLMSITFLFSWVPILILMVVFPLLTALGLTKVVTETRLVKRLTLG
jgi:enoyl-CoA hydratase/carnithine racemase